MSTAYTFAPLSRAGWFGPVAAAGAAVAGCAVLWLADPTTPGGVLPTCPTKALLGLSCPGCGGMRMVYSLLHGDVSGALRYNAVALVAVALMVWAWGAWVLGLHRGRLVRSWQHVSWVPRVALVVAVTWFVVRNLPWAPFTGLQV